jgi:hypothetical protein
MYHDPNGQSNHAKFLLFEDEAKHFGNILYGKVVDEEADKPLEDPHLIW